MVRQYIFFLSLSLANTCFASLPPKAKYVDVWVKDEKSAHYPPWQMYPLKQKYALACPLIDKSLKNYEIKLPQFNSPLFAMLVPCLKLNYKLHKEGISYPEQGMLVTKFKYWLQTCAEENLIDIIDAANTFDLAEPRKLAAAMLDKKIRKRLRKNVYYKEDIQDLKLRPFSFAKQFLPNLRNYKSKKVTVTKPVIGNNPEEHPNNSVSWIAWLKSLIFNKQNENKELVRYKASPFAHIKLKKQPDSWLQKLQSWLAFILWK